MESFIGQICMFGFNYAPQDWSLCNGAIIPVQQNTALFSLLGTTFGGNGSTSFMLPNLQGRLPMGMGNGQGLTPRPIGEMTGAESATLDVNQLPAHTHMAQIQASTTNASLAQPAAGSYLAAAVDGGGQGGTPYIYGAGGTPSFVNLSAGTTSTTGANQPLPVMNPFLVLNFCIALQGIYPVRS